MTDLEHVAPPAVSAPVTRKAIQAGSKAAVLLAGLALFPLLARPFDVFLLAEALVFAQLAVSLDLQWGYTGILNLGPAASFGLGGYTYALLSIRVPALASAFPTLALAMILPMLLAVAIAYTAFRAQTLPIYYALITLSVALFLERWSSVSYNFTGGSNGIINVPPLDFSLPGVYRWRASDPPSMYLVALIVTAAVYGACLWMVRSPFGRVIRGIREDEVKCQTLGFDTLRYKLVVAAVGGAIGGLAGALFATIGGIVHPSFFGLALSLQVFIWVAVGGQGTLWGPLIAAVLIKLVEGYLSGLTTDLYLVIIATGFVLAVILLPDGIAGKFGALFAGRRGTARVPQKGNP